MATEATKNPDHPVDLSVGITLAMVALPLRLAIALASGADLGKELVTAIVAGGLISLFGRGRVHRCGYGINVNHGYDGRVIATVMAEIILSIAGCFPAGTLIARVPAEFFEKRGALSGAGDSFNARWLSVLRRWH